MSRWYAIRSTLGAYVSSLRCSMPFVALKSAATALSGFEHPQDLIAEVNVREGPDRNELVSELVTSWRRDRGLRDLTGSLLILGLWGDLDFVHQFLAETPSEDMDEIDALYLFNFVRAVGSVDVRAAPDIGKSLVRAARRDTKETLRRARDLDNRDLLIAGLLVATEPGVTVPFDRLTETDLRRALAPLVAKDDLDLLVEVFLNERPRQWLVERFKRSSKQITSSVHRVLRRLRRLA